MADITMCQGTDCKQKDTCHRHTAVVNPYWQSYFIEVPVNLDTGQCDHYWNDHGYIRVVKLTSRTIL